MRTKYLVYTGETTIREMTVVRETQKYFIFNNDNWDYKKAKISGDWQFFDSKGNALEHCLAVTQKNIENLTYMLRQQEIIEQGLLHQKQ